VLDGHIVLARRIAERGRYPAIDLEASISRVMHAVADPEQVALAQQFRQVLADHEQNRDLISVGAYRAGADPRVDRAVALFPKLEAFMAQGIDEAVDSGATIAALRGLLGAGTGAAV
jgi:flagellum-specific ATP synthase